MSRASRYPLFIASLAALVLGASASQAQDFPSKPIRIIVPYTAGGSSDYVARTIATRLQENLKSPVVVENKPGGNAQIGCDYVAKSAPDGYTLLLAGMTTHAAAPALYKKLPYDTIKDFTPISNVIESPLVVVVNPEVHANTLKELVALAKANPGKLNYGSAGVGNTLHLAGESFRLATGTDLVHVPYKGASQALGDLLGGRIQVMFDLPQTPLANIQAGKLRALAVTGGERLSLLPGVPTTAEAGLPAFTFGTWIGLVAPAGTPPAVIKRLHAEIVKAATQAEVKEAFGKMAMLVSTSDSPEAFAKKMQAETERLAKVIQTAGIKPE